MSKRREKVHPAVERGRMIHEVVEKELKRKREAISPKEAHTKIMRAGKVGVYGAKVMRIFTDAQEVLQPGEAVEGIVNAAGRIAENLIRHDKEVPGVNMGTTLGYQIAKACPTCGDLNPVSEKRCMCGARLVS